MDGPCLAISQIHGNGKYIAGAYFDLTYYISIHAGSGQTQLKYQQK